MAAISEYYVDPVGGDDTTGNGSIGTPWKTAQKALDTITQDTADGDRINVKDTGDDVLSSSLSLTTYGTPTFEAPLVIQGYTTAAGDGGVGGLSGGGSVAILNETKDFIYVVDMNLHNCGAATIWKAGQHTVVLRCELNNTSNRGAQLEQFATVIGCHFHDIGTTGFRHIGGIAHANYFANGTKKFTEAIVGSDGITVTHNVMDLDGASDGFLMNSGSHAINNSVYSNGGTGQGISASSNKEGVVIVNNVVEGFSGAGGVGFDVDAGARVVLYGNNAAFNNTTNYNEADTILVKLGDNEVLAETPFVDAANGNFRLKNLGNLLGQAYPSSFKGIVSTTSFPDKGAVQSQAAAGFFGSGLPLGF